MLFLLSLLLFSLSFSHTLVPVSAASRTSPPSGALVVRSGTTTSGEFATLTSALNSLTSSTTNVTVFIYPGTYREQVYINRTGPLTILGYTTDTNTYTSNQATLTFNNSAANAGSDDASGTLRIHKNDFRMYNVNVKNSFGAGNQAIALSQYGSRVGLYACGLYGFQDTLYANEGSQVYLKGYIEGATDFIFGSRALAYFGGNTIGVSAGGYITASGRDSDDGGSYVFNKNTIVLASGGSSNATGKYYFGRPWGDYAKVIFKNTIVNLQTNSQVWSVWGASDPNTDHVFFADFNSTGQIGSTRASFATVLTSSQAAAYTISSAVGSDYTSWVDSAYIV